MTCPEIDDNFSNYRGCYILNGEMTTVIYDKRYVLDYFQ